MGAPDWWIGEATTALFDVRDGISTVYMMHVGLPVGSGLDDAEGSDEMMAVEG
ncbi:hypothetical protein TWF281_005424 [Arthrobotrys megalospora]